MKIRQIALIMGGMSLLAGCGSDSGSSGSIPTTKVPQLESAADPTIDPSLIEFNDVPVHDPSVIRLDDGSFYVVGSHLAMARSTDLVNWEPIAGDIGENVGDHPLMSNYEVVAAEGIEWSGGHVGSWASDIIQLEDGDYYFYYNHCASPATGLCDASRSYMGVAKSSDILGPYENIDLFLVSGHQSAAEIAQYPVGDIESYNGNQMPNAIDPDTFYDKDGNLWMVYGSYSGGIFILAMDETTGLPEPDQGYGKKLTGGNYAAIEGPYMLYSPESDYYYLFTSFGGYEAADGYNIRISRSRNPDGPFLDAAGNDMLSATHPDNFADYGVKLMGGFDFGSLPGDPVDSRGYLSPGHNSAYYDAELGQHFLITHTRFPNRGEQHAIRVHEMYINDDNWLVASPQRYAPIEGENIVDPTDLIGDYKFINHGKTNNRTANESVAISLTEGRDIVGDLNGSYRLYYEQPGRITIFLEDGTYYEGVTRWQWNDEAQQLLPVFTAVSGDGAGISVWGVQQPAMGNGEILDAVLADLSYPETFKGDAIDMPSKGTRGAEITWTTDNGNVIKTDGTVIRPNVGEGDQSVGITATVTRNGQSASQTWFITVPERQPFNRLAAFQFEGDLSDSMGNFAKNGVPTGDRIWKEGEADIAYAAGYEGQALSLDGSNGVVLPSGLITNYEYTVSFWANPTVITGFTTAFFGSVNEVPADGEIAPSSDNWISFLPQSWDGNTMLWSLYSGNWFDGSAGERIPEATWSHIAFSVNRGLVKVFIDGEEKFSGGNLGDLFTSNEGKFALGVNYWDLPYNGLIDELRIYEAALTADEITALDVEVWDASQLLESAQNILDLGDTSFIIDDIRLPMTGPYASAIQWQTSNPAVIAIDADTGVVTRPEEGMGNAAVTLTATITLDGQSTTKEFVATVPAFGPPQPVAVYSFEGDLSESTGNFGMGTITGNRIDNTGGTVTFTEGPVGQALVLDGASGVRLPDDLLTDATYTLEMWLNPTSLNQFTPAFFGAASANSWISVVPFGPGSGNTMLWSGTAWYDGNTGEQIPAGSWTHFVAVNNGGNLRLYLNGEQVFSGANFPDVFTPAVNAPFAIGVNYWDVPYHGMIDELKFYEDPATGANVQGWYQEAIAQ